MKKKLWYLLTLVLIVALAVSLGAGALAAEDDQLPDGAVSGGEKSIEGVTAGKYVYLQDDGSYIIELDAFSTGEVKMESAPADIVLVLDVSGSMEDNLTSYSYTPRDSQAYSYRSYGNNTYYYLHTDGNYYPVSREGWNNHRLRFTVGYTNWYLVDDTAQTTYPNGKSETDILWTGVLYTRSQSSKTKLKALQDAVCDFIDVVNEKNADANATEKSRVAVVKFAENRFPSNTDYVDAPDDALAARYKSYIGDDMFKSGRYNYNYTQVVHDLDVVNATSAATIKSEVNGLNYGGATAADFGMAYARAILNAYPVAEGSNRQQVVVMFTDGDPNHSSGFSGTVANRTISYAKGMKDAGAKVYSVAVLQGADPSNTTSQTNGYLHGVSSNYPNATAWNNLGTRGEGTYYFAATSAEQLSAIFKDIGSSAAGRPLGAETVMTDVMSSAFTLPPDVEEKDISVHVVPWDATTHTWSTTVKYTPDQWKTACLNYGAEAAENIEITVNKDTNTVDVTGFDYAKHFRATTNQTQDAEYNKNTAKLMVTFQVFAKPSSVTGGQEQTNAAGSGLYVDGEAIIDFPIPTVTFTPVTYVVDYVTSDTSTDTKASSIKLDYTGVLKNVQMLDKPDDDILQGEAIGDFTYTIYKGKYGTISFGNDATDVQRRYVRYAPTTMDWDGYDRIFIKGEAAESDPENPDAKLNVWAMLAVLPANSVFYEDTYITQEKTVTYNGQSVTIEYTGINYEGTWSTDGTEGTNQTQHVGDEMGWVDGLADDGSYANGYAHVSDTPGAKASFTFSGTGVDIYSHTNLQTGTITVNLYKITNKDAEKPTQTLKQVKIIDTKSASNEFYGVPVCTFKDLEYGTYKALIKVTSGAATEGRQTFYLDGVRVYNPIQPLEDEGNVQQMYGEKNLGAVFTEVRGLLVDGDAEMGSAVFIDELTVKGDETTVPATTTEIATYEKEGPKSEVLLDKNQSVVIGNLDSKYIYYIGLKVGTSTPTTATVNGQAVTYKDKTTGETVSQIGHTTDLYYEVEPTADGKLTITNTGNGILSVTKLRTTGGDGTDSGVTTTSTGELLQAFRLVAETAATEYTGDVLTEEEATEPTEPTEPEVTETEEPLEEGDIVIENGEPEEEPVEEPAEELPTVSPWAKLLRSFFGFFRP